MEVIDAKLETIDEKIYIKINTESPVLIPISEDDANVVKSAFNCLLKQLKNGLFEIALEDAGKDLFYCVAKEYIEQLNVELVEIYEEMEQYKLIVTNNTANS